MFERNENETKNRETKTQTEKQRIRRRRRKKTQKLFCFLLLRARLISLTFFHRIFVVAALLCFHQNICNRFFFVLLFLFLSILFLALTFVKKKLMWNTKCYCERNETSGKVERSLMKKKNAITSSGNWNGMFIIAANENTLIIILSVFIQSG